MASSARTVSFGRPVTIAPDDVGETPPFDHGVTSVVVIVGRAAQDGALLRAAGRANSVTLIAPDIDTARVWLGLPTVSASAGENRVMARESLVVDLPSHEARWQGVPLDLTTLELRLLSVLAEKPPTAWSFAALSDRVWGSKHPGDRSMVRSAIYRLRRKLAKAGVDRHIVTLRGMGFRLVHPRP